LVYVSYRFTVWKLSCVLLMLLREGVCVCVCVWWDYGDLVFALYDFIIIDLSLVGTTWCMPRACVCFVSFCFLFLADSFHHKAGRVGGSLVGRSIGWHIGRHSIIWGGGGDDEE
jgi:hypothetical protein